MKVGETIWRSERLCRGQGDCGEVMKTMGMSRTLFRGQGDCGEVREALWRS